MTSTMALPMPTTSRGAGDMRGPRFSGRKGAEYRDNPRPGKAASRQRIKSNGRQPQSTLVKAALPPNPGLNVRGNTQFRAGATGEAMPRRTKLLTLFAAAFLFVHEPLAQAALTWSWQYNGAGISAAGTFTTEDMPDANGFYQITGISGSRNGVAIAGLQPTGTAVPGNEPYAVDNLVRTAAPQLTVHGFGFSLTNGDYANPFHSETGSYEYLSVPPYASGAGPETQVSFPASIQGSVVPEPGSGFLVLASLGGLLLAGAIRRRRS